MPAGLILYAENCNEDILLAHDMLQRLGVVNAVNFVRDGVEAIEYLLGHGKYADRALFPFPSLVLLDIGMPKVDGFEVLARIRHEDALKRLPVIMISDSDAAPDHDRAFKLGANGYLAKTNSRELFAMWLQNINERVLATNFPGAMIQFQKPA